QRHSLRENFNSTDNPLHRIFPKTISTEIFPELPQKIIQHTQQTPGSRLSKKMPHRTFREDSCIQSQHQAFDPEKQKLCVHRVFASAPLVHPSDCNRESDY
ncbi:MAG: hypothetical protein PHF57_11945, partial [Methanoregula sp.]|nr:hypothetical protein [Methanoregula sp.]